MARKQRTKSTKSVVVCPRCHQYGNLSIYKKTQYRVYHGTLGKKLEYCYLGNYQKIIDSLEKIYKLRPHILPVKAFQLISILLSEIEVLGAPQNTLRYLNMLDMICSRLDQDLNREI